MKKGKNVRKDGEVGSKFIARNELQGLFIAKMQEAVEAMQKGENIETIVSEALDLGVAWEQMEAYPEVQSVLVFEGIGANISDSEIGNKLKSLKEAAATGNVDTFVESVQFFASKFENAEGSQTETEPSTETGSTENTENTEETTPVDDQTQVPSETGSTENTENSETSGSTASPESSAATAAPQAKSKGTGSIWGNDLAAEYAEDKAKAASKAKAEAEAKNKRKAAEYTAPDFSWDKVEGGVYKP